jgi:rhamnosyltransferase
VKGAPGIAAPNADAAARVAAVVVTCDPDLARLQRLLEALSPQVADIIVVDNGSDCAIGEIVVLARNASLLALAENRGIACAQNAGIAQARTRGASHVLLMDQDSVPAPGMVAALLAALRAKEAAGVRVAAVGPRYADARHGERSPFVRVRWGWVGRVPCRRSDDVLEVDHLIASGSLLPMAALDAVGPMCEDLFLYYVDIEWGLRAARAGWRSFGVCAARMSHVLGDEPLRLLGVALPRRDPLRHYYLFRNAVRLYRLDGAPRSWKVADALRMAARFCLYLAFAAPRREQARMMLLGIRHGWSGVGGRFDDPTPRAHRRCR